MQKILLRHAAEEIRQARDFEIHAGRSSPFLFIVGAGISQPSLPLADTIANNCKSLAQSLGRFAPTSTPEPSDALSRYSYWFERAYPQPRQRQHYLDNMIKEASPSAASFLLARILVNEGAPEHALARVVVTPNFDDFIERTVGAQGVDCVACDHPETTYRVEPERSGAIQVVHVHGSHQFYDCRNLVSEIDRTTGSSGKMGDLLDILLRARTPIVIGYSGWSQDMIMGALRRRLAASILPFNLYWFCHEHDVARNMPDWLSSHDNVRFVVPSLPRPDVSHREDAKLCAEAVFTDLIESCHVPPLTIEINPEEFISSWLRRSFPPSMNPPLQAVIDALSKPLNDSTKESAAQTNSAAGGMDED